MDPEKPQPPKWASPSRQKSQIPFLLAIATGSSILLYILLTLSPCLSGAHCYHGYASHHSFDANAAHNPSWMSFLPDTTNISSLSIPGTHDTMTYNLTANAHLQCQNWNISTQMMAGVRYFDIRARVVGDALGIYHADGYTGFDYTHVLLQTFAFLDAYPSEVIIMRLKEEGRPIGENTKTFEELFTYYTATHPLTSPGAKKHFHPFDPLAPLPTLGALRSKILLLQEFPSKITHGLPWTSPAISLEDLWIIPDIYHLSEKWTAIRTHLEAAASTPLDNTLLYLSHISASVGVLPIEAAAGPMNRSVVGMNDMTGQWLMDFEVVEGVRRTGVVIFDFPGRKVLDAVLRWNRLLEDSA